jgi:hypothetical protein
LTSLSHRRKNKERGSLVPPKGGNLGGGVSSSSTSTKLRGILSVAKSTVVESFEWELPGHGEAYADCGELRKRGCNNRSGHFGGLDHPPKGVFVEVYRRTCMRARCPTCFESWISREAKRADWRLRQYKGARFRKPVHIAFSPPESDWGLDVDVLRRKCYKIAKLVGVKGGSCIFHPFRFTKTKVKCFSPHFHIIGFGWLRGVELWYNQTKWVSKGLGVRRSVESTFRYQLSHAGVSTVGKHSITWFGVCSYNKLSLGSSPEFDKPKCPICGCELRPMRWGSVAGLDPPELVGNNFLSRATGVIVFVVDPPRKAGNYYIKGVSCREWR